MGLDYVDIFYSHRFDPETPLEETMGALDTAVRQGKALYAGISSYSAERTREAAAILRELGTPLLIHQPSYSMLNRWIEPELLDTLGELGVGCIGFSPLAQGMLTDRYLDGIPEGSRASRPASLSPDLLTRGALAKVRALGRGRGRARPDAGADGARVDAARCAHDLDAHRRRAASSSSRRTSRRSTSSTSPTTSWRRSTATPPTATSTSGPVEQRRVASASRAVRNSPARQSRLTRGIRSRGVVDARRPAAAPADRRLARVCRVAVVLTIAGVFGTWRSVGPVSLDGFEGPHDGWLVVIFALFALAGVGSLSRGGRVGFVTVTGGAAAVLFTAASDLLDDADGLAALRAGASG